MEFPPNSTEDTEKGEVVIRPTSAQLTHWLSPFFSSKAEAQDAAVLLALNSESLEEELKLISTYYQEKKADLLDFYAPRIQNIKEQIAMLEKLFDEKRQREVDLVRALENHKSEVDESQNRMVGAKIRRQLAWQRILKERFERIKGFFREREARILEDLNRSRAEGLKDADNQIDYLNKFYDLVMNNRREHAEYLKARAAECSDRQKEIEAQLGAARAEVTKLKEIGITNFSATFLLMFGVLALTGSASAAASLLSSRQPGNSIFALLLEQLLNALNSIPQPWGSLTKFAALLFAPIVGVILLFGVFVIFVGIAMRLAANYDASLKTTRVSGHKKSRSDEDWPGSPIMNYISRLTNQFPAMDGFRADRKTYGQLIAYFPYLMLVVIGLFLFSGIAVDGTKVNLTVMLVGVALALLSATSTLLYVTYIIQPRWRAAVTQYEAAKPSRGFFFRYIFLNLEFSTLLVFLVLALFSAAFLPSPPLLTDVSPVAVAVPYFSDGQFKLMSWGMLTVFMLLASFGLAYGIVQKGIFQEVGDLLRRHKSFQNCIERFKYPPLLEDLGYPDRSESENGLEKFNKRQDSLEEIRSSYEVSQMFGPEEGVAIVESNNRRRWPRWLRKFVRILLAEQRLTLDEIGLPIQKEPTMMLRPIDYLDSELAVKEYELSELELTEAEQAKSSSALMVESLQKSINDLGKELEKLISDIEKYREERVQTEQESKSTISQIAGNFRKDEYEFKKAFSVGQRLRRVVSEEPISPHIQS